MLSAGTDTEASDTHPTNREDAAACEPQTHHATILHKDPENNLMNNAFGESATPLDADAAATHVQTRDERLPALAGDTFGRHTYPEAPASSKLNMFVQANCTSADLSVSHVVGNNGRYVDDKHRCSSKKFLLQSRNFMSRCVLQITYDLLYVYRAVRNAREL